MVKTALLMQAGIEFRIQSLVRELRSTCRTMWPKKKRKKTLVLLTVLNRTQRKSCLSLYKYRYVKNTEECVLRLLTSLITCLGRLDTCSSNSFDIKKKVLFYSSQLRGLCVKEWCLRANAERREKSLRVPRWRIVGIGQELVKTSVWLFKKIRKVI